MLFRTQTQAKLSEYPPPDTCTYTRSSCVHCAARTVLSPPAQRLTRALLVLCWCSGRYRFKLEITETDAEPGSFRSSRRFNSSRRLQLDHLKTKETFILPGTQTRYFLDEYANEPIIPGEDFNVNVKWRFKKVGGQAPSAGWIGSSKTVEVHTKDLEEPAALLESRVPRVHIQEILSFKTNQAVISGGAAALPAIAHLMLEYVLYAESLHASASFSLSPLPFLPFPFVCVIFFLFLSSFVQAFRHGACG